MDKSKWYEDEDLLYVLQEALSTKLQDGEHYSLHLTEDEDLVISVSNDNNGAVGQVVMLAEELALFVSPFSMLYRKINKMAEELRFTDIKVEDLGQLH